jgi:hypothetical protein
MTPEQAQEIAELRRLGLSPKQIARKLGLRLPEINVVIQDLAVQTSRDRQERGELPPLERCLINTNAAHYFFDIHKPETNPLVEHGPDGFAMVLVTRLDRHQYLCSSFLVDHWCLGVKDASGPRKLDRRKYQDLIDTYFSPFGGSYQEITLKQAQEVIFGAVDYAANLGFKPHQDFESARFNLGPRLEPLPALEFGHQGKPYYISGPFDQPEQIIRKLEKSVGLGNFEYLIQR